jgi:head-tail adaptor|tara:strand:- start:1225 stop:1572 length:348 start_codon:yes stop_codon:yes gene_type:complete
MAVFAGKFRHRFDLMSPVLGSDGQPARNEFGEETGELKIVQKPWCDIVTIVNSENASTAINGQEQIEFIVRYSKMYQNAANYMIIKYDGCLYDITSAVDVLKRREKLNIFAIKRR